MTSTMNIKPVHTTNTFIERNKYDLNLNSKYCLGDLFENLEIIFQMGKNLPELNYFFFGLAPLLVLLFGLFPFKIFLPSAITSAMVRVLAKAFFGDLLLEPFSPSSDFLDFLLLLRLRLFSAFFEAEALLGERPLSLSADFFGVPVVVPFFFAAPVPFFAGAFGFCLRYSRRAAVGTLLRLLWTRFSRGWSRTIEFTVFLVFGTLSGVLSFFGVVPFAIY